MVSQRKTQSLTLNLASSQTNLPLLLECPHPSELYRKVNGACEQGGSLSIHIPCDRACPQPTADAQALPLTEEKQTVLAAAGHIFLSIFLYNAG